MNVSKNVIKLPITAINEHVIAKPIVACREEEIEKLLDDIHTAARNKTYIPQTATEENPDLSELYVFEEEDQEFILCDLSTSNFVGKIKDVGKGAKRRKQNGLPQEYLYVFQYSCKLCKRYEGNGKEQELEDILIYIKINNRTVPYKRIIVVSFHKNNPR